MEGYTLLTIIGTILAVLAVQRLWLQSDDEIPPKPEKPRYREDAFKDIIKINEETLTNDVVDVLTGLPGRECFDERLRRILLHSEQFSQIFSIMILNIDSFNSLNQSYGSVFGNELLLEVAKRVRKVLRQIDTVSRYAGDSFYIILPELSDPEVAVLVAQRIQDALIQPFSIEKERLFITVSMGISIFAPGVDDAARLVYKANDALTQAKQAGRNTYRIYQNPDKETEHEQSELAIFLGEKPMAECMQMLYRPYLDIYQESAKILQAVPYVKHPELGLVEYNEFYHALEACGRTVDFGQWQIMKIFEDLAIWKKEAYYPENIILKMTLKQLENTRQMLKIQELIEATPEHKNKLVFDIANETLDHQQPFGQIINALQFQDIRLSISMMALGRLALHSLQEFPVNFLKIDEKLVKNLTLNLENEMIISAMISVANNTNVTVIAEGVTLETQKLKLKELGCSLMSGDLFITPQPPEALTHIVAEKHRMETGV